jgi:hypothetical protein
MIKNSLTEITTVMIYLIDLDLEETFSSFAAGLPDGFFSNQKHRFG